MNADVLNKSAGMLQVKIGELINKHAITIEVSCKAIRQDGTNLNYEWSIYITKDHEAIFWLRDENLEFLCDTAEAVLSRRGILDCLL